MVVGAYSGVIPDLRNKILDCLMGAGLGSPVGMELPKAAENLQYGFGGRDTQRDASEEWEQGQGGMTPSGKPL